MSVEAEDIMRHTPTLCIPLTQGRFTIIDSDDWHLIAGKAWHLKATKKPYASRGTPPNRQVMHQLIMGRGVMVDHRDGDGLNNQRNNLRRANNQQNQMNQRTQNGRSYKGVSFHPTRRKYQTQICIDGKLQYLGLYDNPLSAALAYDHAARKHFGDFAHPNFEVK